MKRGRGRRAGDVHMTSMLVMHVVIHMRLLLLGSSSSPPCPYKFIEPKLKILMDCT